MHIRSMDYQSEPSQYQNQYVADQKRYEKSSYLKVGSRSGLKVSHITLGTWQNFSDLDARENVRNCYLTAVDHGINSFDFGNNYGRPPGSAEEMFGTFLAKELKPYRDELIITTKAGYDMWPGPNGRGSSLKYLLASLDQSLARLGLDYVDIFYSHCYDPDTPIEETADALDMARRSGRCLYVGISSYSLEKSIEMHQALAQRGTHLLVHQSNYSILNRWPEAELLEYCEKQGVGFMAFSPLAQGFLSHKYLANNGITKKRADDANTSLWINDWQKGRQALQKLKEIADKRGQSIAQMAISWVLHQPSVCSAVIGARTPEQIIENLPINTHFSQEEMDMIDNLSQPLDVDLWKESRLGL